MDIETLKEHILENDLIVNVLTELGCHHIKQKNGFIQCANPDGDNTTAICVYENTNLTTVNYTRDMTNGRQHSTDLISLVEFIRNDTFPQAIKWICDILDLDYYADPYDDLPESLKLTKILLEMTSSDDDTEETEQPLKPIPEKILSYYKCNRNQMFADDGVSFDTQAEFEIGYDDMTNRITIPIRDDIGNLVGVKGRYFDRQVPEGKQKFLYLEKCARSQILYGLYKNIHAIKNKQRVFVTEAEKGVLQLYDKGYCEAVATGGAKVSKTQIDKLTRLCVPVYFVFDKDITMQDLQNIADKFVNGVEVYALVDTIGILNEKESPTDDISKFERLLSECVYRLK